jgi:hypothetical protein
LAIKNGSIVKDENGGASIDLFRIPQWFYDEVMNADNRSRIRNPRPESRGAASTNDRGTTREMDLTPAGDLL